VFSLLFGAAIQKGWKSGALTFLKETFRSGSRLGSSFHS